MERPGGAGRGWEEECKYVFEGYHKSLSNGPLRSFAGLTRGEGCSRFARLSRTTIEGSLWKGSRVGSKVIMMTGSQVSTNERTVYLLGVSAKGGLVKRDREESEAVGEVSDSRVALLAPTSWKEDQLHHKLLHRQSSRYFVFFLCLCTIIHCVVRRACLGSVLDSFKLLPDLLSVYYCIGARVRQFCSIRFLKLMSPPRPSPASTALVNNNDDALAVSSGVDAATSGSGSACRSRAYYSYLSFT